MEGQLICFVVLSAVISFSPKWACGSVLVVTAQPGENITLYCDTAKSTGVFIVWYKNCTHMNQPPLVLTAKDYFVKTKQVNEWGKNGDPRFHFVNNQSSNSYDLLIQNITESDEGFYYCGTEETKVEGKECVNHKIIKSYGNVTTRIVINSSDTCVCETPPDHGVSLSLILSLCAAAAVASSLLSSLVVYCLCRKKAKEHSGSQQEPNNGGHTRLNPDEEVCYASVTIHQASQRSKKKKRKVQSSDFSTYSAINTSR